MNYEIEEYVAVNGKSPFSDWLVKLKDVVAKAKLVARVDRAAHGNFGDWKPLVEGVFEMRENYGPGYRIFYGIIGQKVILLLAGSTKRDQKRIIEKAKKNLADYERRMKE
ncbi:MAG: addiction module protein [Magnetococcales bacterium]|nr:addiction module protein [Magnetococcales bacterium]HIJ83039.1 type II toxin-antitoxin system RelE/ParE family toxin [Magnetococcales bacterium]